MLNIPTQSRVFWGVPRKYSVKWGTYKNQYYYVYLQECEIMWVLFFFHISILKFYVISMHFFWNNK